MKILPKTPEYFGLSKNFFIIAGVNPKKLRLQSTIFNKNQDCNPRFSIKTKILKYKSRHTMLKRKLEIEKELDVSVFLFGARLSLNLRPHK